MNEFLLKIVDLFKGLFQALRVDYQQLRAIVSIKLTMDNRRQVMSYRRKDNQEPANTFLWTLFFYSLFGGFIAIALYGIPSFMISMIMFFSYIMVMIAMTLITDFSSILLDTSDNTIILPRPVDSRTMFVARLTHILLYLGQLTVGLAAIPSIVIFLKYGALLLILFVIATVLSVIMAVFLTNTMYLLILQFANEEKLKNVINYFQIVMAVFIMGGYQLLPRMAGRFNLQDEAFEITWWVFLLPPVWMAGTLEMVYLQTFDTLHVTFTLLALVVPILGFYLVSKYLTPVFTRKLGVLGTGNAKEATSTTKNNNFIRRLSGWLTSNPVERGAFELIFKILGRDRKIKLKIYPAFGYVIIFGLVFLFRGKEDFTTTWNSLPNGGYHIFLIYLTFMILQVGFYEIPYSDDFKASWIYFSAPLERPGDILAGTLKALFTRIFIPGYALVCVFVIIIWRVQALDDIVFGFFNNFLMLLILALVNKRYLPLSMMPSARNQAGSFIRSMLLLVLIGSLGFGHYLLATINSFLVLAAIPLQLIVLYILLQSFKKTTWSQVTL